MSRRWPPGTVKIHEGCGGLVRWVEAIETPGVGYFGECRKCHEGRLAVEQIVPVIPDDDANPIEFRNSVDAETLSNLEWDYDADWDENQERLRRAVA